MRRNAVWVCHNCTVAGHERPCRLSTPAYLERPLFCVHCRSWTALWHQEKKGGEPSHE